MENLQYQSGLGRLVCRLNFW